MKIKFIPTFYKILFLSIILIPSSQFFCQNKTVTDTLFFDENNIEISRSQHNQKYRKSIFYQTYEIKDGYVLNKIAPKCYIGKFNAKEFSQIKNIINRSIKSDLEGKSIVISYVDSLYGFYAHKENYKLNSYNHFIKRHKTDSLTAIKLATNADKKFDSISYYKSVSKDSKVHYKCFKKLNRKNSQMIFMYRGEKDFPFEKHETSWVKDSGIFRNNFFRGRNEYERMIINSKGDYLLYRGNLTHEVFDSFVKNSDWSNHKTNWNKSLNSKNEFGFGFIEKLHRFSNFENSHCY